MSEAFSMLGGNRDIPGTYVFTGERSARGYRLNKFAMSLMRPANRDAFRADEQGYMAGFNLSEEELAMVARRDWDAMIRHGGNIYIILKIGGALGVSLLQMGAQMRGQTPEEFLATRPGTEAKARVD